eukprot:443149-Amphidinium_carterae.1
MCMRAFTSQAAQYYSKCIVVPMCWSKEPGGLASEGKGKLLMPLFHLPELLRGLRLQVMPNGRKPKATTGAATPNTL